MAKKEKLRYIKVILKNGRTLKGFYSEDEYYDIYDHFYDQRKTMTFRNMEVFCSEVAAIDWGL